MLYLYYIKFIAVEEINVLFQRLFGVTVRVYPIMDGPIMNQIMSTDRNTALNKY